MEKDKSIIERFADTLRDVAKTATDAASVALKSEPPAASTVEERNAAYMPLAADGLVGDPMMLPRPRRRKRAAPKRASKTRGPAKKAAEKSSARKSKKTASKKGRATSRKTTARKAKASAKRRATKSRRR